MKQAPYVPPHLRQKTASSADKTADDVNKKLDNEPKIYIPPHLRQKDFSDLQYSQHAMLRQEQRSISKVAVEETLDKGILNEQANKFENYRDENNLVNASFG